MPEIDKMSVILPVVTPGIIQQLIDNRHITPEAAALILFNSKLYKLLEDDETKLWHLSHLLLYDMLEEELTTGEITFPEEQ
jgi:hypothetical protein